MTLTHGCPVSQDNMDAALSVTVVAVFYCTICNLSPTTEQSCCLGFRSDQRCLLLSD